MSADDCVLAPTFCRLVFGLERSKPKVEVASLKEDGQLAAKQVTGSIEPYHPRKQAQ